MKDLKERVIRGGLAKIGTQVANLALRLGSLMILARLLEPKDFGLVAMVTAISGGLSLFKDAGLSMATVQRDSISQEQMSTLFWVNVLVGVILASLMMAVAPFIADFYHEPQLFWVALALTADFLFTGAAAQHSALLQRQMRFGTIAAIEFFCQLTSISVAIVMALNGMGYWALVGQAVTSPGLNAICTWGAAGWLPGLPKRGVGIRSMLRFGGLVTLNGLVVYIAYNVEKILLGRFWGAEALGVYGRAYQLINIPTENINSSISGIAFSALSRIQNDPIKQKRYFLKGYSFLIALTLPITIACAVFAEDVIFVVLGPKWSHSVPIFRLLAPTIVIFALINPFAWFLYATGRAGRSLKLAFVIAPLVIVAYIIGLPYGPKGVALAYSIAMALWVIPHIAWCIYGTEISAINILQTIIKPMLSGIMAGVVAFGFKMSFSPFVAGLMIAATALELPLKIDPSVYPYLRLVVGCFVLISIYLFMLMYAMGQKKVYLDLLKGFKGRPSSNNEELA